MKTLCGLFALFCLLPLTTRSQVGSGGPPPPQGFGGPPNPTANPNFQPPSAPRPGLPPRPRPVPPGVAPETPDAEPGVFSVGKPTGGSPKRERTFSSLDAPDPETDKETFPPDSIRLTNVDLQQIFKIYEDLSGRTMIPSRSEERRVGKECRS